MIRSDRVACLCGAFLLLWVQFAMAQPAAADEELILRVRTVSDWAGFAEYQILRWIDARTAVVRLRPDSTGFPGNADGMARAHRKAGLEQVEPNYRGYFAAQPIAAGDPLRAQQWWLDAVGAERQWALAEGQGVRIAVVDSGVDLQHPDLQAGIEAGGHDFGDDTPSPQDRLGHGTSVAGVIVAQRDNGVGIAGLAPAARVLPLKINVGMEASFTSDRLALAIRHAVAARADIINLSLTAEPSFVVREAIDAALAAGVIVVAAAGNAGGAVAFPANVPGVLAVAASGRDGLLFGQSNRGAEVAFMAPGEGILSTQVGGGYVTRTGTSLAAPQVSAALAALRSLNPDLSREVLQHLLAQGGGKQGDGYALLDSGAGVWLAVPQLTLSSTRPRIGESVRVGYRLPPLPAPVDLYVALDRGAESWYLSARGRWERPQDDVCLPLAQGYQANEAHTGQLFGESGVFPALRTGDELPGPFRFRVAAVDRRTGRVLGKVTEVQGELQQ